MSEISIPITTLLSSSVAIWLLILSWRVAKARQTSGISLGDGGDVSVQRKVRAQANLVEYAPTFIILIGIAELQGGHPIILSVLALTFLIGRLAHGWALAFAEKSPLGRIGGIIFTFISMAFCALYCLTLIL